MNETIVEGGVGDAEEKKVYATLMTDESETERFNLSALDDETIAFIEDTTFPGEVLLVAQKQIHSRTLELRLVWAVAQGDTLQARVETFRDRITDASANATLVARLTLGDAPIPMGGHVEFVDWEEKVTTVDIE